jgi:hypothetical protein
LTRRKKVTKTQTKGSFVLHENLLLTIFEEGKEQCNKSLE